MELLKIEGIGKKFCKKLHLSLWYGFKDLFAFKPTTSLRKDEQWALDNINITISEGEFIGILGKNGSGKSTLVRIIIGIYKSTVGTIQTHCSIIPLFLSNLALNRFYSGLDNYYFMGAILGISRTELNKRIPVLKSFSGLGEDIYASIGTYSSGMRIRMRFGAVKAIDPGMIIIDEALSVSDEQFQNQCFNYLKEFSKTKAVVFISHDLAVMEKYCNRIIVMKNGMIQLDSTNVKESILYYVNSELDN